MFVYKIALRTSLNTSSWNSPRLRTASLRGFASTSAKRGRPSSPSLTTLHPQLLQPSDFHSLSSLQAVRINYGTRESNEPSDIYYKAIGKNRIPFPTEARGFFYFHPGPSYAPIVGELRFRVVPTGSPTDFNQGHDLLAINQCLPWSIPLASLLSFKGYSGLASLLKCHFMPTLSSVLERVKEDKLQKARTNSTIIHALGQPLFTRVDQISITHCIAKGEELGEPRSWCMFSDHRGQGKTARRFAPYTGSIVYAFERDREGHPLQCCIRTLDIVEPIGLANPDYNGHLPPPVKGELLQRVGGGVRKFYSQDLYNLPDLDTMDKQPEW